MPKIVFQSIVSSRLRGAKRICYMVEKLLSRPNMLRAYQHVVNNKGSAGVDSMKVSELGKHLKDTWSQTKQAIEEGKYLPSPIKGVEIPKPNGKKRLLGIPTVEDRLIQQGLYQLLMPIFEKEFQTNSYGFRPKKNAHQAVQQAQRYINEGYQDIVVISNLVPPNFGNCKSSVCK